MIRIRLISLLCMVVLGGYSASAQIRIISKEKLDSVSNPTLAHNASAMDWEEIMIKAEPMNEEDSPKEFRYSFVNVSESALNISRVVSTCTCAPARCSKREVGPGESADIIVRYDPSGHPGRFERKFFVYTDGNDSPSAILKLAVVVSSGEGYSSSYPLSMGRIRLRSSEVRVYPVKKSVERLKFVNVSDAPLQLSCDRMMLPECLGFSTEPAIVAPGEEGEMIITFDPEKYAAGPKRPVMKVVLSGMGVPPSQSSITVKVEK